ncbi:uncharacterized protein LOC111270878 [Varroa jacobsoni]|uniref:uncharacterized protein LOC111270878 n=1 Tax=Varroa jacobsoni TaxID=62625 RepID=UPI000BF60070|nr:uncharacterized protein LOC111270878 [Varroa jacobsoni]
MTSETTAIYAHRCPDLQAKLPFLSSAQANRLEDFFTRDKNPQIADVVIIAAELGLPVQAVRIWFDNRLSQWRESQAITVVYVLLETHKRRLHVKSRVRDKSVVSSYGKLLTGKRHLLSGRTDIGRLRSNERLSTALLNRSNGCSSRFGLQTLDSTL